MSLLYDTARWARRTSYWLLRECSSRKIHYNSLLNWREFWHGRVRLRSFPRHIQLGTNLTCNLRCIFCRRQHPEEQQRLSTLRPEERIISWEIMEKLMPVMRYAEIVNITPYGEPLLYPDLERLVSHYTRFRSRNLALTTNGIGITKEKAELLTHPCFQIIFFSIDTADEQSYREMRAGGELDKVVEGIELINEQKKRQGSSFPRLILASTFMRRNIEQLPGLIDFGHRHGFDEISVQLMEIEVPNLAEESLEHYLTLTRQQVEHAREKAARVGIKFKPHLALMSLLSKADAGEQSQKKPKRLVEVCHNPWYFMLVDTNGDVRPCCYAASCWGNLGRESLSAVWNGAEAQQMRLLFLKNIIPKACRGQHCGIETFTLSKA